MESTRKRGPDGRFDGVRWNVEAVPRLPTFPARWVLEDPRQRPYFVFWAQKNGPAFALKMPPSPRSHGSGPVGSASGPSPRPWPPVGFWPATAVPSAPQPSSGLFATGGLRTTSKGNGEDETRR